MRVIEAVLYYLILGTGLISSFVTAIMFFACIAQLSRNRKVHGDFMDRVQLVSDFRNKEGRLPTDIELNQLSGSLPVRFFRYNYEINTTLSKVTRPPHGELSVDNWTLSFWRGEWSEYYLSWNGENTLDWQASGFRMGGTFVLPPLIITIGCFLGAWALNQRIRSRLPDSIRGTGSLG